jgi:ABC-type multidrug transport system permease subunit
VFYRENAASYYLPEAFALSNLWTELPLLTLMVFIFTTIFYPMVGFEVRTRRLLSVRH